jgi:DNA polymerase (family X)
LTERISLGRAYSLSSYLSREVRRTGLPLDNLTPVGGVRRFAPHMRAVTLLGIAAAGRHPRIMDALARLPGVSGVAVRSNRTLVLKTERGEITIHLAAPEHAGSALVWHTGRRAHVERLAAIGTDLGVTFADGLIRRNGAIADVATEANCYAAFGLPLIVPELREGGEEIDAALDGRLPRLVEDLQVRGDLHMHTNWSDGRDLIEDMAGVARQLGYEYIAITDHSERSMASRKLAREDVAQQREEIADVRRRVPGVQILHGVEVDIMPDGSLDFDDDVLAEFDIVLASLHDHAGQDPQQLIARYMAAVDHPLVNVITHPANRSPGHFEGYDLDFNRLFEAAVRTGTALEIDGAPGHLDMDGAIARRAVAAGVTLTIDSDAHRAEWLGRQMRFGVGTARRGWVEPQHVLNARSIEEVRGFIGRKRTGRIALAPAGSAAMPSEP